MSSPKQAAKENLIGARGMLAQFPGLYSLLRNGRDTWRRFYPTELERLYLDRPRRIKAMEQEVERMEARQIRKDDGAVLFFNMTSGPQIVSFNSISGLVMSWALRLAGHEVLHLVCQRSIPRCVQGTNWLDLDQPPPCDQCLKRKGELFPRNLSAYLDGDVRDSDQATNLTQCDLSDLERFVYRGIELGRLSLPSVRFAIRRHDLTAVPETLQIYRDFIQGGIHLVNGFERLLDTRPIRSVVVFNGSVLPEAVVREVALKRDLPVISYEVGYRTHSIFLTHGIATAYPVHVPEDFQMGPDQQSEFDRYITQRMKGNFTMGGARFWPEMKSPSPELVEKASTFRQVLVVFTNVIFDTSQVHSNTIFESMFDWLDETMKIAGEHPDTLFVVRAHPDELRPGKESHEPVGEWMQRRGYGALHNVHFIAPTELVSSYELIGLSHFVIVYNSTVGIEATLLGKPVVTGGKTRYSQESFTHSPGSRSGYKETVESFIKDGAPSLSDAVRERARRYMYYSLFRTSLDLSAFVEPIGAYDFTVKPIHAQDLHPDSSQEMRIIYDGIINGKSFCYT